MGVSITLATDSNSMETDSTGKSAAPAGIQFAGQDNGR